MSGHGYIYIVPRNTARIDTFTGVHDFHSRSQGTCNQNFIKLKFDPGGFAVSQIPSPTFSNSATLKSYQSASRQSVHGALSTASGSSHGSLWLTKCRTAGNYYRACDNSAGDSKFASLGLEVSSRGALPKTGSTCSTYLRASTRYWRTWSAPRYR